MKPFPLIIAGIAIIAIIIASFVGAYVLYGTLPAETSKQTEVYFCPETDCFAVIASLIENSSKADCALYTLNSVEIESALKQKQSRIVVDGKCPSGVECKSKPAYIRGLMHDKFCVLDDRIVITGSFNPNEKSSGYRNNMAVIYSKYIAKDYADEFNELWEEEFGAGAKVKYEQVMLNGNSAEIYFCPEDNCRQHLIGALNKAKKSVYFMTYSFTDNNIAEKLEQLHENNVIIRGFFDSSQNSRWSVYGRLKGKGIDARIYNGKSVLHHKVFIIDNETVVTGSYNPTGNGNENNDENMVILQDKALAMQFAEYFSKLQNAYK